MKKVFFILAMLAIATLACAEEEKGFFKKVLDTAVSPIETVLGQVTELERIVVAPSRSEEKIGSASTSVSVITKEDFERRKVDTVREALGEEVGVDVNQSGAFQGETSLLIRGGNPNHTLVMIDGLKAYDPIAPGGAYNLAHLTLDNVDRIEVLRGPQSALYGSDAMSGVVSITTKKAEDTYVNASWEGGSFFTYKEKFEMGSAAHGFHYSVAGSRLDTKGISQAEAKQNCQERDPYDKTAVSARVDYDICDAASAGATMRYTKSHFAFDQGANADDDNAFSQNDESFFTIYGEYRPFETWNNSLRLGWMEAKRMYFDDDSPGFDFDRSKYFGTYFKLDYQSTLSILDVDKIVLGYEFTKESAEYYSQNDFSWAMAVDAMSRVVSDESDFYMENRFNLADRLTSTQGFRLSHHSRAGTHMTYRFDASYMFATATKVRALIATGFKAPSLYQLFAPASPWFGGGNQALQPEKSFSYEYGAEQYLFGDRIAVGTTYFYTLYANLITCLTNPNTFVTDRYINIGKAQVHGVEATVKIRPVENVRLTGGFTYQKTKDIQNDQDMIRRPERKFFVECFWQATESFSTCFTVKYNGPMSNNTSNPLWNLNTYKMKEFVTVDCVLNYNINKTFSVYAKLDNILNKHYEETYGYGEPPFGAYGGVKASF